jgi:hypothetical protein
MTPNQNGNDMAMIDGLPSPTKQPKILPKVSGNQTVRMVLSMQNQGRWALLLLQGL